MHLTTWCKISGPIRHPLSRCRKTSTVLVRLLANPSGYRRRVTPADLLCMCSGVSALQAISDFTIYLKYALVRAPSLFERSLLRALFTHFPSLFLLSLGEGHISCEKRNKWHSFLQSLLSPSFLSSTLYWNGDQLQTWWLAYWAGRYQNEKCRAERKYAIFGVYIPGKLEISQVLKCSERKKKSP